MMSAYMTSPKHIATCADILRVHSRTVKGDASHVEDGKIVYHPEVADQEVRLELAGQNEASVSYRYSDEGRAGYSYIADSLKSAGWKISDQRPTNADEKPDEFFPYPPHEYLSARPLARNSYGPADAHSFLCCLEYQSCEHPEWKESKAFSWMLEAYLSIGYEMAKEIQKDQRSWDVDSFEKGE